MKMLAVIPALTLTLASSPATAQKQSAADKPRKAAPVLCQGHYQTEAEAVLQLKRMAATYSSLKEWEARAAKIRRQIL
ncbi:MAG: hypothetical protein VB858_15085, partial [Planctomycetaceae bacterium]